MQHLYKFLQASYGWIWLVTLSCFFSFGFTEKNKTPLAKPDGKYNIKVKEPSGICMSAEGNSFYIVSDDGILHETDITGKITRTASEKGVDFEGVYATKERVYVIDETMRKVMIYRTDNLVLERTVLLSYFGGRNKSFEAITYNKKKGVFLLITEKEPTLIREYDENFVLLNEIRFKGVTDIADATWYNDHLYFLSDEDMCVIKVSPDDYSISASIRLPIINPEGIAFSPEGNMYITSDDMQLIYYFNSAWQ